MLPFDNREPKPFEQADYPVAIDTDSFKHNAQLHAPLQLPLL